MASWRTARLQRTIQAFELLLSDAVVTPERLARSLNLTAKQAYACIQDLNEIGVPVDVTPSGFCIPSALIERESDFSLRESIILSMGLRLLEEQDGVDGETLEALRLQLFPQSDDGRAHIRDDAHIHTAVAPGALGLLRKAVWKQQRLRMSYRSRESHETTGREISPYTLVHRRSSWYVIAYCHLRGEARTFKAARMEQVERSANEFYQDPEYDPNDYLLYSWNIMAGKPNVVLARFDESVGRLILEKKLAHGRVWQEDQWVYMQTLVSGLDEFSWWIMQYGEHAEVMQPLELRRILAMRCAKMSEHYADAYTNRSRSLKPCRTTSL
ncbi:MAG: WYL domain-containing protein [Candidatus Hinthialibacter antarcticus]|nr:WYL domain-containing protein [Candidatus Hinthialibacter antarcticus]